MVIRRPDISARVNTFTAKNRRVVCFAGNFLYYSDILAADNFFQHTRVFLGALELEPAV